MFDDLNANRGREDTGRERPRQTPPAQPLTDREVPIAAHRTPASIHAWLDGEVPEAAVRQADTLRQVEFWSRINAETERRRQMRTPVHVQERIMEALPQSVPQLLAPWWRRELAMSPTVAVTAAAGLLALGVLLGITLR
jgi:hypothetical protein